MNNDWPQRRNVTGSGERSTGRRTEEMQPPRSSSKSLFRSRPSTRPARARSPSAMGTLARSPVVGAAAIGGGTCGDLHADGGRSIGPTWRCSGRTRSCAGRRRPLSSPSEAVGGGPGPRRKGRGLWVTGPGTRSCTHPRRHVGRPGRQRLFRIIEDLVLWENTTNETVLQAARDEIWQSWRRACLANVDHPRAKEGV